MIDYYNYLTSPSGLIFNIKEIKNKEFLILLKFLNGENFKGFYEALDSLLIESIPNFLKLNLCDKAYIYIAYYFYSVRSSISIKSEKFDSVEVPLTIMLDSIEENYNKTKKVLTINNANLKIHYPKKLLFDDNNQLFIDILSGITEVNNYEINEEKLEKLRSALSIKAINDIEYEIIKNYDLAIDICKDLPGTTDISENILSPNIFYSIAYIYKDMLENFYNMLYLVCHYIKIGWEDYLSMTPIETTILYKNFIDDKEQQNKNNKNININDPIINENLLGV